MRSTLRNTLRLVGLYAVLIAATGCNRSDFYPVSGMVTVDGEPVSAGRVLLVPTQSGRTAVGAIQSDGSFSLNTDGVTGVRAGEYQVAIRPPGNAVSEEGVAVQTVSGIPDRYRDSSTSDLTCTVNAGMDTIHFQLTAESD